jgi:glutamine synthetase
VASTGSDVSQPSRNRTVLVGLLRDLDNPIPTRFEIRAPNPHTNTYLALAAFYQAMMDGMAWAAASGGSAADLQRGVFKAPGVDHPYLEKARAYRSEEDVFEHYDDGTRECLFGRPPATVWETLASLDACPEKTAVLSADGVFSPDLIDSYRQATLLRWTMELSSRIVPDNARIVGACSRLDGENRLDEQRWLRIEGLRRELARDDVGSTSLFTRVREAVAARQYGEVSRLQLEMAAKMAELAGLYRLYRRNIQGA